MDGKLKALVSVTLSYHTQCPVAILGSAALPESGQVSLELLFLPLEVLNIFHLGGGGDGVIHNPRPELQKPPSPPC